MSSGVQPVFNLNEKTGGGFGGSEWLWVVVLFVLLGGGGNLFGNKGNAATQADIQRGFDYSNEMSQMRGLTYGQTAQTADLIQRLRPAPVPAFIVPAPTGTTTPTP